MVSTVKLWMSIAGKSFKSNSVYKVNIIINFLAGILLMYVQVAIWTALYSQGVETSASLKETITYMILNTIVIMSIQLKPGDSIGLSVSSGDIGAEMVRPMSLLGQHSAHEMGKAIFKVMTYVLPTIIFAVILFGGFMLPNSIGDFLFFLVMICLGVIICLLINTVFGYTAFWLYNNWYVSWFESGLLMFFGGTTIPLWFYPDSLQFVSKILPFRYVSFEPINCYLGRSSIESLLQIIAIQLGWVIFLLLLERLVWHRVQRKIVVQGG